MYHALLRQGVEFTNFGNHCRPPSNTLLGKLSSKFTLQKHKASKQDFEKFAARARKEIQKSDCDLVFAPVASAELYYLSQHGKVDVPVVYASDVTFSDLLKLYKPKIDDEQIALQNTYETAALSYADKVVYPTEWATRSAISDYQVPSDKLEVAPYGANISDLPLMEDVERKLTSKCCRLVFIGVAWERKGGDLVVETFKILREKGFNVELYILGSNPRLDITDENLHVIPFLNKNLAADRARFNDILLNSHFLLFPTKADTFGIVNCEANAYGIPVIASDAGGVPSVIREGINGHVLPVAAPASKYADAIAKYLTPEGINKELYRSLMLSARKEFDTRLNWDAWGESVYALIKSMVT